MSARGIALRLSIALALAVLLPGCGIFGPDSNTTVRAELVRLPGESATAAVGKNDYFALSTSREIK